MGDLAAFIAAVGALLVGVLGFVVPPAKDRAARLPGPMQGTPPAARDYADDYVAMLRADSAQMAEIARLGAVNESLEAEKDRLLSTIARRDEKIRQLTRSTNQLDDLSTGNDSSDIPSG